MLRSWLLPDASYDTLFGEKNKVGYRARHGKPPLVIRGARTAGTVVSVARERYLGAAGDESMPHATRPAS